jgi:ketosteroid isomerase-like protein
MDASEREAFLERAYQLFNGRDVDALLSMMTDDVEWPDVANSAILCGKEEIRRYWEAQFAVSAPTVRPTEFIRVGDELVAVVDQRIHDLDGQPLVQPTVVFHRYTFDGGLVRRMVVFTDRAEAVNGG